MFLYADDILLLVKDPFTSVPFLMNTIERFSELSGNKIRSYADVKRLSPINNYIISV